MTPFAANLFGWVADEIKANKPAELAALAPVNIWAAGESVKLADDFAAQLEAHDPTRSTNLRRYSTELRAANAQRS